MKISAEQLKEEIRKRVREALTTEGYKGGWPPPGWHAKEDGDDVAIKETPLGDRLSQGVRNALNPKEDSFVKDFALGKIQDIPSYLMSKLMNYYRDEMPYEVQKGRGGDPYVWLQDKLAPLYEDLQTESGEEHERLLFQCQECSLRFKDPGGRNVKCPRCGGDDIDMATMPEAVGDRLGGYRDSDDEDARSHDRLKVQCLECGKNFMSNSMYPSCPRCKSSDVDLLETMDPMGKEDSDVNNDGKTNIEDKYLKHRRDVVTDKVNEEIIKLRSVIRGLVKESLSLSEKKSEKNKEKKWMQRATDPEKRGDLRAKLGIEDKEDIIPMSKLLAKKRELQNAAKGDKNLSASDRETLGQVLFAINARRASKK